MTLSSGAAGTTGGTGQPARLPWLLWLLMTGLTLFALWVAWDQGLLGLLVATDRSRLSIAIGLIYLAATVLAARRVWYLSLELEKVQLVERRLREGTAGGATEPLPAGFLHDYVEDLRLLRRGDAQSAGGESLVELHAARARGPLDSGWFLADMMLKLGLLGTIVGFILMLGSVAETTSLDANTMQKVLRQMSVGMGTALYTTLAGLAGSVLASAQLQIAERATDELVERSVHLGERIVR